MILAGVSLSFVFNGGILDKSQEAVNEYQNAANNESDVLEYINETLEKKLNEIGGGAGGGPEETPSVDGNGLADKDTTITTDDPNIQIVIPKGFAPAILQTGTTQSLPGENGAVKEIIPVEDWVNITSDQINKGIVVVDNAITYDGGQPSGTVPDFNEYVWIPMPDSSKFARVAWNGSYYADRMQNGTHPLANSSETKKYWEEADSNMIDSVRNNKGFYISRYEASEMNSTTAQSKRGQKPWIFVPRTEAKTASRNMKSEINSHLIYGVEWDSILQWLLDSNATIGAETSGTKTISIDDIQSDSRSWGNYLNSVGEAATNAGDAQQPGGTNEYWKVNNIYDLAGNVNEWTQENYSTGNNRVVRGGGYSSDGDDGPATFRYSNSESSTTAYIRVQGWLLCVELYSGSDN